MILPPWVYAAVAAGLMALGFGAGWKVASNAAKAEQLAAVKGALKAERERTVKYENALQESLADTLAREARLRGELAVADARAADIRMEVVKGEPIVLRIPAECGEPVDRVDWREFGRLFNLGADGLPAAGTAEGAAR